MPDYPMLNRRNFIRSAAGASAAAALTSHLNRGVASAQRPIQRRFAPVHVSRGCAIREVVGLRPYRDEGYVVEALNTGNKLLVHQYGHWDSFGGLEKTVAPQRGSKKTIWNNATTKNYCPSPRSLPGANIPDRFDFQQFAPPPFG